MRRSLGQFAALTLKTNKPVISFTSLFYGDKQEKESLKIPQLRIGKKQRPLFFVLHDSIDIASTLLMAGVITKYVEKEDENKPPLFLSVFENSNDLIDHLAYFPYILTNEDSPYVIVNGVCIVFDT